MATCAKCGRETSFWARSLGSGLCPDCQQQADAARAAQVQRETERQRELEETIVIGGKRIACPICGHDRFSKQRTLMNTRGATFLNVDWMDAGAETCICHECGYVLWFRK